MFQSLLTFIFVLPYFTLKIILLSFQLFDIYSSYWSACIDDPRVTDGSQRLNSSQRMRDARFRASTSRRWKPRSRSVSRGPRTWHPSRICLKWESLCQCKRLKVFLRPPREPISPDTFLSHCHIDWLHSPRISRIKKYLWVTEILRCYERKIFELWKFVWVKEVWFIDIYSNCKN